MQSGAESRAGFVQSTMQCKMDCRLCNAEGVLLYYFALRWFAPRSINCCAAQCCAKPSRQKEREGGAIVQKSVESRARFVQSAVQCKTEGEVEELLYKIRCAKSCAIQSGAHLGAKRKKQSAMQCKTEQRGRERRG